MKVKGGTGMNSRRFKTDYVRIASSIFIDEFEKRYDDVPTGIIFNKYLTLLHRDLKSNGINIQLSHCWYRWGDAVVRYSLPYINWTHDDLDITKVSYRGNRPVINEDDDVVKQIRDFAGEFFRKYNNDRESVECMVDEVYTDAPFQFQNDYRKLRESLKISRRNSVYTNYKEYAVSLLEQAMASFPKEFSSIKKQKDEFVCVFRESAENGASVEDLFDITESFWFFFCYHLRMNNRCHENVSRETLNIWRSRIPEEKSRFESSIQNYAYQLCRHDTDDQVIKGLLKDRESRLSRINGLFDELGW